MANRYGGIVHQLMYATSFDANFLSFTGTHTPGHKHVHLQTHIYIHYSHTITHTCQTHKNTKTALDTNILIYPHTHTHMHTSSHTYNYKHKRLDQKLIGAITAGMAIAVPVFVSLLAGSVQDWFNIQTLRNIIQLLLMNIQRT